MKSEHQLRVEQFMELAEQELPKKPTIPDKKTRILRAKLILEEAKELIFALGCQIYCKDSYWKEIVHIDNLDNILEINESEHYCLDSKDINLKEIYDGCLDLRVVTTGTISACGLPDEEGQLEVDNNNLAKFKTPECPSHGRTTHVGNGRYFCDECSAEYTGPYRREDGKFCKSPRHKPPELQRIIDGHTPAELSSV